MNANTSRTIIATAMVLAIAVACWATKSAAPLWALLLIGLVL